ncbi:deoxynucleotidyltransferase terminal-interacting protein 2 [Lycorma delicatula]|uniref:deoxynucleotidyltransferase terminal-interacting protein 2 n=1 Tax=Lycorma delicatula TaxID=130591 RepID=UPI003F50E409
MPKNIKDFTLDDVYVDMEGTSVSEIKRNPLFSAVADKVLEKSIMHAGFETLERVPCCSESLIQQKMEKKKEKSKTKGPDWFNMKTPAMTTEIQNDLRVLHMRSVLDPKHFYKKNDIKGLPKYFQVGKYVDSPVDFYSSRLPRNERRKTIVEELMADAQFQQYNKRKHKELIQKYKRTHAKAYRHSKRLKKGKKR